jgi:FAD/FMN-containing dehydrogenase/Fe-S oxidoreductase
MTTVSRRELRKPSPIRPYNADMNAPTTPAAVAHTVDIAALEADLRAAVQGPVWFEDGARALYSSDSSNYRQVPIGVVLPKSVDDIVAAVEACHRHGAPVLMRGAGTSLAGQTCNVAVVLDCSRYVDRIVDVDTAGRTATVEPGVICDSLRVAAERHGLTYGPDPATHSRCTLGGMIGNNSCGAHSVMAGKTVENIEAMEILTYDGTRMWVGPTSDAELEAIILEGGRRGEIYAGLKRLRDRYGDLVRARFPKILRRVSGFNLDELLPENGFNVARALVGTEGTCAVVLHAKTRLVYSPPVRVCVALGYEDIYIAGDRTPAVLSHKPVAIEGLDFRMIEDLRRKGLMLDDIAMLPRGGAWLLVELGTETVEAAAAQAAQLIAAERAAGYLAEGRFYPDPADQKKVWGIREVGAGASNAVPGERVESYSGWEDAAVDPNRLGDYLREFRALLDRYGYRGSLYGHFGDGCIHVRITFDFFTEEGVRKFRAFGMETTDLVVKYGGSISGEHGDGQARAEFLPRMYGEELVQAFREFKAIWDPGNRMNPGKVVDPYRADENLRYSPTYRPAAVATRFSFAADFGSFAHATERCLGVGKCRNLSGGAMCPSYRGTLDEKNSTRGRIRLLSEMLRGDVVKDLWRSEAVKEALDLCLACKSCKNECPVQVDMATYKAEFLAHYHENRPRPRQAETMGRIFKWAARGSIAPRLVNFVNRAPVLSAIAKRIAGIAPQRDVPRFSARTYRRLHAARPKRGGARRVVLWADTFNNHFHAQTAAAAVDVLEAAGCDVVLPPRQMCCGRPLYDFGLLEEAKALLASILDELRPEIEAGTPVVGLEPACLSVFRDELLNLFPEDAVARKLAALAMPFSDYLVQVADWRPGNLLGRKAVVHMHCHHRAVLGLAGERELLTRLGLDFTILDSGCCGMAGSFGFKPAHYDLSVRTAERVLLPAVRSATPDTLIITDGYSCREQIDQLSGRTAMHIAEVARMAL